jgi:hypothetical protein
VDNLYNQADLMEHVNKAFENHDDLRGMSASDSSHEKQRMIGPLTESQRLDKVRRYLDKKHKKSTMKKFTYMCRKQVAEKRLRIKGRFVTKEQAFEILGLTQHELLDNQMIQELLTKHSEDPLQMNSLVES